MTPERLQPPSPSPSLIGSGAVVVHGYNAMDPSDRTVFQCRDGLTLKDLAPITTLPTICAVNGEFIHPADWELVEPVPGDHVGYLTLPKGGGGGGSLTTVLGIIAIVVGVIVPGAQALIAVGAALLVSGLMAPPVTKPIAQSSSTESPSPTYNIQLSGNSARLGQAMPVVYGRHVLTPDFAAVPYTEFDGADNQYYFALFCLGVMDKFTLESVMIDDTVLSHFIGFETQLIGPQYPGVSLTLVNPAVVNAPEVANQELLRGTVTGPFAACGPGLRAVKIGMDIVLPKGLYFAADDGTLQTKTVQFMFEARPISDSGAVAGSWFLLGIETLSLNQNSAVRRTYNYTVTAGRYEVRAQRLDEKDTNARAGHDVNWAGLRAYLNTSVPLDPNANFLALKIKANNQLSGLSQRRISVIVRRWLPTWSPGGGWTAPQETRSIAWALADILKNTVYGGKLPDNRVDLQTLYELDQLWASRGDTFNAVFDKRITIWAALTTAARAGRARPVMRGSVFTFVRDTQQTLPVALFNMRNIKRGSFSLEYDMVTEDSPDGIEMEFFDEQTWGANYVTMPLPGVTSPVNLAKVSLVGVTNLKQAQRECAHTAADSALRRTRFSFTTEMDGFLPAFGDLIAVSHDVASWGYSGEVQDWNGSEAVCSEEITWTVGDHYMILTDDEGDVHGPFKVAPGNQDNSVRFLDPLTLIPYSGTEKERTRYAMGPANQYAKLCRVTNIQPRDDLNVTIRGVVEDNRVHTADLPYAGDGNQGGGGGGGGGGDRRAKYAPDGLPNYDAASDSQRASYGFYSTIDGTVGTGADPGYTYDD